MSKILFQHYGIKLLNGSLFRKIILNQKQVLEMIKKDLGFPCVIKPNDQGSTVGLTICKDESEVFAAVNLALEFSNIALSEEYIDGHEITVGIIEGTALPALEIKPKHGLYDYECKYTSGMSEYIVPLKFLKMYLKNFRCRL